MGRGDFVFARLESESLPDKERVERIACTSTIYGLGDPNKITMTIKMVVAHLSFQAPALRFRGLGASQTTHEA